MESEQEHYGMCSECRKKYLHYPVPKWLIAGIAGLIVCVVISYGILATPLISKGKIFYAARKAEDGYVRSALQKLDAEAAESRDSIAIPWKMMDIAMDHQYYDYAARIAENYLVGEEVSDEKLAEWEEWNDELDVYYETNNRIMEAFGQAETIEDIPTVEGLLQKAADEGKYDNALLYYAISSMAMDAEQKIDYLNKAITYNDGYTYMSAELANLYRRQGNFAEAERLFDSAYEQDKEEPATLRGMAIMELLNGNSKKAVKYAKQAYDINVGETYVIETYLIALAYNGDTEEAEAIQKEWEDNEYVFEEDTIRCMKGEITPEQYYMDKEGENKS